MRDYYDRRRGGTFKVIVVLIILFLIWGFLGAKQVEKTGLPCKIGYQDKLCWSWEKKVTNSTNTGNLINEVNELPSNLTE
ncbi:MAG: hypothetical protein WC812_02085 [Candidatus Pacearchaeota archaeon]|jgi:hypothetical protein